MKMIHRVATLVVCLVVGVSYVFATRRDIVTTIRPEALYYDDFYPWKNYWNDLQWCSEGTYAYAFDAKMEPYQGPGYWGDDSALNGIMLKCR